MTLWMNRLLWASLLLALAACGNDSPDRLPTATCNPLDYGAVGDGVTDNTSAIQNAVDACAAQGGGTVELTPDGTNVYVSGPFTLKSYIHLEIDRGVTLQATTDHSRYVPAYINFVYQPNEALVSANGATNVGILGEGVIDGASDRTDPKDGGRTWYEVAVVEGQEIASTRPWMIEFYRCNNVTISGITIRRHPYWAQAIRFSTNVVETGVTIDGVGRNSDGVDLVGVTNAILSNLDISVSDDNIAIKSGLAITEKHAWHAKEIGLPRMATSNVLVKDITLRAGQGISIGSEAANGVHDVTIENVTYDHILYGFRIKSGRDRGAEIYNITARHLRMTGVGYPIALDAYYSEIGPDPSGPAQPVTDTTPQVHDITVEDLISTESRGQAYIRGLPESCYRNIKLTDVSMETIGLGLDLLHMTGTFTNVVSTTPPPNPPFEVRSNVHVTTAGTTPPIDPTPPQSDQTACR